MVREMEKKLDEEGLEIDDDEADEINQNSEIVPDEVDMGTGTQEAAFGEKGGVVDGDASITGKIGKAMEGLGLSGRGKDGKAKMRRKGKDGLVDV